MPNSQLNSQRKKPFSSVRSMHCASASSSAPESSACWICSGVSSTLSSGVCWLAVSFWAVPSAAGACGSCAASSGVSSSSMAGEFSSAGAVSSAGCAGASTASSGAAGAVSAVSGFSVCSGAGVVCCGCAVLSAVCWDYTLRWPYIGSDNAAPYDLRTDTNDRFYYLWRKYVPEGREMKNALNSDIDTPIFRYAGALLSLAEALNETGQTDEADLHQQRKGSRYYRDSGKYRYGKLPSYSIPGVSCSF